MLLEDLRIALDVYNSNSSLRRKVFPLQIVASLEKHYAQSVILSKKVLEIEAKLQRLKENEKTYNSEPWSEKIAQSNRGIESTTRQLDEARAFAAFVLEYGVIDALLKTATSGAASQLLAQTLQQKLRVRLQAVRVLSECGIEFDLNTYGTIWRAWKENDNFFKALLILQENEIFKVSTDKSVSAQKIFNEFLENSTSFIVNAIVVIHRANLFTPRIYIDLFNLKGKVVTDQIILLLAKATIVLSNNNEPSIQASVKECEKYSEIKFTRDLIRAGIYNNENFVAFRKINARPFSLKNYIPLDLKEQYRLANLLLASSTVEEEDKEEKSQGRTKKEAIKSLIDQLGPKNIKVVKILTAAGINELKNFILLKDRFYSFEAYSCENISSIEFLEGLHKAGLLIPNNIENISKYGRLMAIDLSTCISGKHSLDSPNREFPPESLTQQIFNDLIAIYKKYLPPGISPSLLDGDSAIPEIREYFLQFKLEDTQKTEERRVVQHQDSAQALINRTEFPPGAAQPKPVSQSTEEPSASQPQVKANHAPK